MSTCISRHGEFGSHELDDAYTCTLCGVLDEEALTAELISARAAYERVVAERDKWQNTAVGLDKHISELMVRWRTACDRADKAETELSRLRSDLNQATAVALVLWPLYEAYRDSGNVEPSREELDAGYVELVSREDSLRMGSAFEVIFDRESEIRAAIDAYRSGQTEGTTPA